MGFWSFLFGKPAKIADAFFGEMQWVEITNDPSKSYFECTRYFKPSGKKIGLSVTGSLSGPTQQQKEFFAQVETDYPLLIRKFILITEERLGAWMPQPIIKKFEAEFNPTYLRACLEMVRA
jgi:hypothetical protein